MADSEEFDLSAGFLPAKSIPAETRKRLSLDSFETISPKLQEDYEGDGWVIDKVLKRTVRMRRKKSHDRAFEDRTWAAMAKLNFIDLNRDRNFRLPYGVGKNESQQIDVFAADDDVVLVIECKSAQTMTTTTLKSEVEAIVGRRQGLVRTIKKRYPQHKIKFILATNNLGISQASLERIDNADIVHMDEDAIDYYLNLAEHLGHAARYQLLGFLFAGTKIPGIDHKVPAIQGKMGGYTYYSFAIEPARLLKLSYILHRNKANNHMMPTYQRLIKKPRLKRVQQFVDAGGFFPNSIIMNLDAGNRGLRFERVSQPEGEAKLGMLHLPQVYRAAFVIDGQHRLYGYAGSERADTDLIPVVAFVGLPRQEQVQLFMQINENQQAVPKNLRNTLNADLLWESDDMRDRVRALKLRIAQILGEHKTSPLYGRVLIGENPKSFHRCITIEAISSGVERGNFIGTFSKTEMKSAGSFYRGTNESTFDALVPFLIRCFNHVKEGLPVQWALGSNEGGFVFINNGIESMLRIFGDIVDHLVVKEQINPSEETPQELFEWAQVYLDPMITFLDSLDSEQAMEFRRLYGSGGKIRYWRNLQLAINGAEPGFTPAGLMEYEAEQEKQFNTESFNLIRDIESFFKTDIRRRLEDEYGNRWFKDGVPNRVYLDANALAAEKNQIRDDDDEVEPWDCLHLIDYHAIVSHTHDQWERLFKLQYTLPTERDLSGSWKNRSKWMVKLNAIRNENDHNYAVTEDEYEFLVVLKSWLLDGQSDGAT